MGFNVYEATLPVQYHRSLFTFIKNYLPRATPCNIWKFNRPIFTFPKMLDKSLENKYWDSTTEKKPGRDITDCSVSYKAWNIWTGWSRLMGDMLLKLKYCSHASVTEDGADLMISMSQAIDPIDLTLCSVESCLTVIKADMLRLQTLGKHWSM